jgi:hypothetical protein
MTMNLERLQGSVAPATVTDTTSSSPSTATPAAAPASLLPDPSSGALVAGDMGAEIAALAVKLGKSEQDLNAKAAETQDQVEDAQEAAQVQTMHDEASTLRDGAWESGMLQIGAGACTVASGGISAAGGTSNFMKALPTMVKGVGEGLNGAATITGGLSKAAATDLEANATASKSIADAAGRAGGVDRDTQKNATQFVQAALDFYREYETAKAQSQAAALHGA